MKDSLIPSKLSPGEWMDMVQDITGIYAPGQKRERDTTERITLGQKFQASIQAYMDRPVKIYQKKVQALMKTSDLPDMVSDMFDTMTDIANFDLGWQAAYKDASNRIEAGRNYWEILTLTEGDTWELIPEGHSVQLGKRTGSKVTVEVHKYGSGVGWSDEAIRFRKIGPLLDQMEDFRRGYWRKKTNQHYELLANAAKDDIDIYPQTGGNDLENDILALNNTAYNILLNLKDSRNLDDSTEMLLYISPKAKSRILRALSEVSQAYAGSKERIVFNIRPIFTFNSNLPSALSGDSYGAIMCVPGYNSQTATVMEPTFYNDQDILSLSYITTGFSYYGACIADTKQVRQMSFG
jgi:hypothetical protein